MEVFEAIVGGEFVVVVEAYMQAISGGGAEPPDVAVLAGVGEVGLDEEEVAQAMMVLYDVGFAEEQLEEENVRVTALGLMCLLATKEEIADALLWHNVYYKLGLLSDMAVVSIAGDGEDELQSVEPILRVRGFDDLVELQYGIYNNLPPF